MTALIDDFLITRMCNFDLEKSNLIPVKKVVNISTTHFYFDFLNFHETLNFITLFNRDRTRAFYRQIQNSWIFRDTIHRSHYHNLKRNASYFVAAFKTFFFLATSSLETTRNSNIRAGQKLEKESPRMNPRPSSLHARKYRRDGLLSLLLRPPLAPPLSLSFHPAEAAAPLAPRVQRVIPPRFIKGKSSGVNGVGVKTKARVGKEQRVRVKGGGLKRDRERKGGKMKNGTWKINAKGKKEYEPETIPTWIAAVLCAGGHVHTGLVVALHIPRPPAEKWPHKWPLSCCGCRQIARNKWPPAIFYASWGLFW